MSTIETEFRARALAHAGLVALIGQRIALDALPQDTQMPDIVYSVKHNEERTLDGTLVADDAVVSVECWAQTGQQSLQVADLLSEAVVHYEAGSACTETTRANAHDPETDLHAVKLSFQWIV